MMAMKIGLGAAALLAMGTTKQQPQGDLVPTQPTCEHRVDPLGLDVAAPRLSWRLESPVRGDRQMAYHIVAATTPKALEAGRGDLWDSGRVESDRSQWIPWGGAALPARAQVWWKVRIWDAGGRPSAWSEPARFELGLVQPADWGGAQWIRLPGDLRTSDLAARDCQTNRHPKPQALRPHPAPLLRRGFTAKAGIIRARVYVAGLGLHELYVNGERIGDGLLDPAITTYDERAFAVTYDITARVQEGANAVGLALGNGFFGQSIGFMVPGLAWGPPAALARVVIDYADGTGESLVTDMSWRAATGPVVFDNLYAGESYDARLEIPEWCGPGFDDTAWTPVETIPAPTRRVSAQDIPPCRRLSEIRPLEIRRTQDGRWIVDLGQNIAGWVRLKLQQPAGTRVTLRFAEILDPGDKERLDTASTGVFATGCEQTDIYVCKGGGAETWEPRFTCHGFRFVEIAGVGEKPEVTGIEVATDLGARGSFSCSDPLLNRIHQVSMATIRANVHGITEDCPHRERCAWLGDAHAQAAATLWNFNAGPLFAKMMDDIETVLGRGGQTYEKKPATPGIPCNIAVGRRLCQEARPDWGAAVVLLPWEVYRFTGDDRSLRAHYPLMARWVDYVSAMAVDDIVHQGYGDWCPPGTNSMMECPVPLSSTAYHAATLKLVADAARMLGKDADAVRFDADAARFRAGLNRKFFDPATASYGSQTANALVLRFGLEPDGQRQAVGGALAREVTERHGGHPFVGIHGGTALFTMLSDLGHADTAWKAMRVEGFPGFQFVLDHGMTTWPEVYLEDFHKGTERSLNHPMQSGFASWFHDSVGGIRPVDPGFRRFELAPRLMRQLDAARVEHLSPYGPILSEYRREGDTVRWTVVVPVGTEAAVRIPTGDPSAVRGGDAALAVGAGVSAVRNEDGAVMCTLGGGRYEFLTVLSKE